MTPPDTNTNTTTDADANADTNMDASVDSPAHAERYRRSRRRYAMAWVALLVLLAVTAEFARWHLGIGNLVVSLGIAALKAAVVAWVFMALRKADGLIRLAAGAGVIGLLLLGGLSGADFGPRRNEAAVWQTPQAVEPSLTQRHAPAR